MFTGIVEEVGTLQRIAGQTIGIAAVTVMGDLGVSDSIAVNGVCLTVTSVEGTGFTVDVVPETRRRTNLGELAIGAPVNLERALAAGGRLGGHIVQGHVEGTARIEAITPDGEAHAWRFAAGRELLRYVVPKGFIAIDGISLTVVDVDEAGFSVTIIPFTRDHTNLRARRTGDRVNIETDILGRYVERLLAPVLPGGAPAAAGGATRPR